MSAICFPNHSGGFVWALTVGNDGHVTDVRRVVHETTDLMAQLASFPSSLLANIVGCGGRCVRGTYLLDCEAGTLLASMFDEFADAKLESSSFEDHTSAQRRLT
jgi:hypothetical protein